MIASSVLPQIRIFNDHREIVDRDVVRYTLIHVLFVPWTFQNFQSNKKCPNHWCLNKKCTSLKLRDIVQGHRMTFAVDDGSNN